MITLNQRIVAPHRGGADGLEEEPLPEPGPNDARLKVLAAGVAA